MKRRLCVLLCMLLISTILVAALGAYLKFGIFLPAGLFKDRSVIEMPFAAYTDPAARFVLNKFQNQKEQMQQPVETVPPTQPPEVTENLMIPAETIPEIILPVTEPPLLEVTENWFDDVLFIGDSRTVGLRDYARLGQAEYFCDIGMTVFDATTRKLSDENFTDMDLPTLLQSRRYNKIYISLGLNECGEPYDLFMEAYGDLVDMVHAYQPHAIIILQSMITISREKAASKWYFALENIQQRNAGIQALADGFTVQFIDANVYYADEEGYMPDGKAWDGCHFDVAGYEEWSRWILENAKTLNLSFG